MSLPLGILAPIQTRKFAILPSQPSLPARVLGRNNGRHDKRRNDIRKRHPSFDFDFLSFRFCDRPACPVPRCGGFTRHTIFTIDTTTASGQPVRFLCRVRTTTATPLAWFPRPCIPSFCARVPVPPLSQVRFHPMTIAQRTTLEPVTPLSNSEALAMPRTPTTTCTFLALGCPPFRRLIVTSRHGRNLDGHRLSIQVRNLPYHPYLYNHQLTSPFKWAKNPPSSVWRYDRDRRSPPPAYRSRDRSRSPRRRGERERERVDDRDRDRDRDRERDYRDDRDRRRRSRSPVFERRRTPSPDRRATKERVDDRARTPPPPDDLRKEDIKAVTPPYDR